MLRVELFFFFSNKQKKLIVSMLHWMARLEKGSNGL